MFEIRTFGTILLTCSMLGGCAHRQDLASTDNPDGVTTASTPKIVLPYSTTDTILDCIRDYKLIKGVTFVVGPFADSTGKVNANAAGSTGNFLPQGGSASYITEAIKRAGGEVISTYFGQPRKAIPARYAINGIFNSLDFGTTTQTDMRVGGIGPTLSKGWAQLSLTIQLDELATNVNRQISMVQRPVRYSSIGIGIGRSFGDTLVSGAATLQNQERLQFESLNGPIALGVADVILKEFPKARMFCALPPTTLPAAPDNPARLITASVPVNPAPDQKPLAPEKQGPGAKAPLGASVQSVHMPVTLTTPAPVNATLTDPTRTNPPQTNPGKAKPGHTGKPQNGETQTLHLLSSPVPAASVPAPQGAAGPGLVMPAANPPLQPRVRAAGSEEPGTAGGSHDN
ncbi:hypothetical protein [Rhizobium sp. SSA_523]|uniref:hypothetical protein n=1 Tax=Rhizobium sp. SSA_523 TaxID=2952477 RepID=UPI00208FFC63|nr:hypothetical protein [Rhizobium sp. SSA_523]MCO5730498.1 hypothetical protein [Rhizobium sp. SSA_523]WKC25537.1 hypothetical protein QTJ18_16385 [Rhizobium sp. SSA_523]